MNKSLFFTLYFTKIIILSATPHDRQTREVRLRTATYTTVALAAQKRMDKLGAWDVGVSSLGKISPCYFIITILIVFITLTYSENLLHHHNNKQKWAKWGIIGGGGGTGEKWWPRINRGLEIQMCLESQLYLQWLQCIFFGSNQCFFIYLNMWCNKWPI